MRMEMRMDEIFHIYVYLPTAGWLLQMLIVQHRKHVTPGWYIVWLFGVLRGSMEEGERVEKGQRIRLG